MSLYIGTATNPKMMSIEQEIQNFLLSYAPQQIEISTEKEKLREWKRNYMKCLIGGEIKNGVRNNGNIVNRDLIALDLDYIKVTTRQDLIHELENTLSYRAFLYPSISCTNNILRYRLVIPLSAPITSAKEYKNIVKALLQKLIDVEILAKIDNSNLTWSQVFGLPIVTQFTPDVDKEELVHVFEKPTLQLEKAQELGQRYQQFNTKPKDQAMLNLAKEYVESDEDKIVLVQSFANRNREWLRDYNNYLACQFEIKFAEEKGEVTHEEALRMVSSLALDDDMAKANQEKYEAETTVKKNGIGLAYFVSKDQVKSRIDWLQYDPYKNKHIIRFKKLSDEILSETHYIESSFFKNGSVIYDNERKRWLNEESERMLENKVTEKLDKAGVWSNRNYRDALTFIKVNAFQSYLRNPFDAGNPYEIMFSNQIFNVKEFITIPNTASSMIPNYHKFKFHEEWYTPSHKLKKEFYPEITVKWLKELLNDDDAVNYLITLIGYCFVRTYNDSPAITVLYGHGNNGKSTFLRYMSELLGYDNLASATIQQLGNDNLRFVSSKLYQKEANIFADTGDAVITNFDKIKALSGGDSILAEYKGRDMFDFTNYAKLIFSTNGLPKFKDFSPAVKRRLRVIEFAKNFDEETTAEFKNKFPLSTIYQEQEKLVALAMQYLHEFLTGSKPNLLSNSQKMKDNVNAWIDENDTDGAFINKFVLKDDSHLYGKTKVGESLRNLYQAYVVIQDYYGNDILKKKDFIKKFDKDKMFFGKSRQKSDTKRVENIVFSPKGFEELEYIIEETGNPLSIDLNNCVYYDIYQQDKKSFDEKGSWNLNE